MMKENLQMNYFRENVVETNELILGIIPSGGWETKRCEPVKWIEICNEIKKKYQVQIFNSMGTW